MLNLFCICPVIKPRYTPRISIAILIPSEQPDYRNCSRYWYADVAAIAPSDAAVITWRRRFDRTSPAANKPAVLVAMDSSVKIPPSGPQSTRSRTSSVAGCVPANTNTPNEPGSKDSWVISSLALSRKTILSGSASPSRETIEVPKRTDTLSLDIKRSTTPCGARNTSRLTTMMTSSAKRVRNRPSSHAALPPPTT